MPVSTLQGRVGVYIVQPSRFTKAPMVKLVNTADLKSADREVLPVRFRLGAPCRKPSRWLGFFMGLPSLAVATRAVAARRQRGSDIDKLGGFDA